jgi:hypothetical protein
VDVARPAAYGFEWVSAAGASMIADLTRFERAIALFDAAHAEDPRPGDGGIPSELVYARRMSEMLERLAPDASEEVKLAVRAQHLQRWKTPRDAYPMDRPGYLAWRAEAARAHAALAGRLLREAGYGDQAVERVQAAVAKRGLKVNPETQLLEDVADLVFLEHYLEGFAAEKPDYAEEKWLDILAKTWRKMSERARAFALSGALRLPPAFAPLVEKAVARSSGGSAAT